MEITCEVKFREKALFLAASTLYGPRFWREVGMKVRSKARKGIKKKPTSSLPGSPPNTRGKTGKNLKNSIIYDADAGGVLIGPSYNVIKESGMYHEFGLTRKHKASGTFKIGGGGPIRIGRKPENSESKSYRQIVTPDGRKTTICRIRLTTQAQVNRATLLHTSIVGPSSTTSKYPARPFMGPGLEQAWPEIIKLAEIGPKMKI